MNILKKSFANNRSLLIIYYCTILTFCSLYAAQPIQPVFQEEFNLTQLQAILFTSLMMLPLGFAPLFYGYILENFCTRQMISLAVLALGIMEFLFACSGNYWVLLSLRACQGLIIPAVLTGLMSYISLTSKHEDIQHNMALYIGATITGGFLGRFLSGLFTELFGWRVFFFILGVLLVLGYYFLRHLDSDGRLELSKPNISQVFDILKDKRFLWIYLSIFFVFIVFAAVLNLLPFELKSNNPDFSETGIGLMYLGYIMGVLISFFNRRLLKLFTKESTLVMTGIVIFIIGTLGFSFSDYRLMFIFMFVFCTGMFTIHTILSGFLNKLSKQNKSLTNGIYLSFYYTGGAIGSFFPGILYEFYGWNVFLFSMVAVLLIALSFIWRLKGMGY
ncbi:MAG: MFS transporter [Gammaproteobacteria bacterium]|nr:MFS transporter [Gammaproteobacteria bacterium]